MQCPNTYCRSFDVVKGERFMTCNTCGEVGAESWFKCARKLYSVLPPPTPLSPRELSVLRKAAQSILAEKRDE